ncbi:MAG: hypothetical protein KDK34_24815, partial [Leptospiraceae bacterium]|nr:hypothetical protein [Leptospiraceae bacterium]
AADKAKAGDRFILSEGYYDLVSFTQTVAAIARVPRIPRVMPLWFARLFAAVGELVANITGNAPLLPKGQLHFLQWRAIPNADKARRVLNWDTRSLSEGVKATIAFLQSENVLPNDSDIGKN